MPVCRVTGKEFTISQQEKEAYARFGMDVPNLCPQERIRYFWAFGNPLSLFWTKDGHSGETIMTNFDPEQFPEIYEREYWMSGEFDSRDFGRDIDFSRSFFEQWHELMRSMPQPGLTLIRCEDCNFSNYAVNCKRCYLVFNSLDSENVFYSAYAIGSKDSIELFACRQCELCFQCLHCKDCYNVKFSSFAERCHNAAFLSDCEDCSHCYQCVNLKHKQYCHQNVQYTKAEYEQRLAAIDLGSTGTLKRELQIWHEFLADKPLRGEHITQCENSDGVMLSDCNNCHCCYQLVGGDNNTHCLGQQLEDSCDAGGWMGSANLLWTSSTMNSRDIFCSLYLEHCYNLGYCLMAFNSHDCFGCYGLNNKEYCLLNKQYTKQEYETMRAKLIEHMKTTGEWGQWFPYQYSPYFIEDSALPHRMSTSQELSDRLFLRRREPKAFMPASGAPLPVNIKDMTIADTAPAYAGETSRKSYKITPQELTLHQRLHIAPPTEDWLTRITDYYRYVIPFPNETTCASCKKPTFSWIPPEDTERPIWCDACFGLAYRS